METIIRELARETQVRDRQGQVLTTFRGTLFTLILRVFLIGLTLLFVAGFTTLVFNLIVNGIQENVQFGIYN
jgi:hypothetical protein|tara:strand:+ start:3543 stop:3758 length:216 start_codon:yes stop_codon:yes gene_type:complete